MHDGFCQDVGFDRGAHIKVLLPNPHCSISADGKAVSQNLLRATWTKCQEAYFRAKLLLSAHGGFRRAQVGGDRTVEDVLRKGDQSLLVQRERKTRVDNFFDTNHDLHSISFSAVIRIENKHR